MFFIIFGKFSVIIASNTLSHAFFSFCVSIMHMLEGRRRCAKPRLCAQPGGRRAVLSPVRGGGPVLPAPGSPPSWGPQLSLSCPPSPLTGSASQSPPPPALLAPGPPPRAPLPGCTPLSPPRLFHPGLSSPARGGSRSPGTR